jgi:heme/copper-type cytochrome/quinol oxidase subunit 3
MPPLTVRQQFFSETEEHGTQFPAHSGSPPPVSLQPPVSNARLGMLMLIAAETMLFVGLIGSYVMFRIGSVAWPSAHLYLPIGITWLNTAVLVTSGYTMHGTVHAARIGNHPLLRSRLRATTLLGILFLSVQGYEWLQLIRDGLTISTGIYGATFYTLIGCHALHVFAAVVWLGVLLGQAGKRVSPVQIDICRMYWQYVCALWVVLFALVYLN